jgi:hypothetical protein
MNLLDCKLRYHAFYRQIGLVKIHFDIYEVGVSDPSAQAVEPKGSIDNGRRRVFCFVVLPFLRLLGLQRGRCFLLDNLCL